ncbi:MAG: radical SAM protein [Deltaproteobacteria bacterium]|nr:radical SAM protein [Deltaproteobacteria bacterium]
MKTERLFKTPLSENQKKNSEINHLEFLTKEPVLQSYPRRIVFELTNKCNFQCIMCGRETVKFKTNDLQLSVIKACESFFPYAEEVTLQGWGESTLHPKLPEILEYLNTFPPLRKYFITNGSTLPKVMDAIFAHHVDLLAISLDGTTPETNNSIRKGGDFRREINNIKMLLAEKKRRNSSYPYVNFVFTAMMRNIHELPDMIVLAKKLGIPEVKVVYLTIFNESLTPETLVDKQELVRKFFREAKARASEMNINLKLPPIQGEDEEGGAFSHKPCAFPWRDLYIGSDGYIRPCQSSAHKILNISGFTSFREIWNSKQMQEFRERVNDEQLMSENCKNCYQSTCANWNRQASFIQLGKKFAPEWEDTQEALIAKQALEKLASKGIKEI